VPLALRDVSVAFGAVRVLDGLDLSLATGETVAIMGPSGSGKTTLLSVIAGLRPPDHGSRAIAPGDRMPNRIADLSVAWVFQTSPVLMRRTALENAALGPRCAGAGRDESRGRALAALEQLGIADLAHQRLHRLSGGERQRVVIARAMSSGALLVIADEPTAALDGDAKALVCESLSELARHGASVVVATHDLEVASSCSRLLRLSAGRLAADPAPRAAAGTGQR
jgi:ABC-type lipoprotein export system ATPase subunit